MWGNLEGVYPPWLEASVNKVNYEHRLTDVINRRDTAADSPTVFGSQSPTTAMSIIICMMSK